VASRAFALAVFTALALTGCSSQVSAAPTPAATEPAGPHVDDSFTPPAIQLSGVVAYGDISAASSMTVVVNKHRPLSEQAYVPANLVLPAGIPNAAGTPLRADAAQALEAMAADAQKSGITIVMASGYRSFETQIATYNSYVTGYGQAAADTTSARPGFSEHQTGLAADLSAVGSGCTIADCFETTAPGQWLAANSWRFGYILRYPKGAQAITGYNFEPWHFRYVGLVAAFQMHDKGINTLEEYFGLEAAPDYVR
jgi:D-alanyl-D-alanine carboxypeptidase